MFTKHSTVSTRDFPRHNVIRQVIQRTRNAYNAVPVQPINRESIELPESFTLYEKFPNHFEKFLLADSGLGDHDRILIFGRESIELWLDHFRKIYVDGTFSLTPHMFSQVFVILAERGEFVLLYMLFCQTKLLKRMAE